MKRFLNFGIAALLSAFSFCACAEALRATLDNGLKVVIVKNALAPVVTTQINYLAGSNEAPEGFPGMAHAQEHMMFRGSPDLSAGQLADISAEMGGMFDADTQQSVTQYFFTVPANDLNVALHIEAARMKGVLDSDALWEKERGAIEQEVAQDLSNPEYVFYSKLLSEMFRGTPLAHDALGTKASFDRTTGARMHDYYEKWYAPNNAILVIVGNVDPDRVLSTVKTLFGGIPSRPLPKRPEVRLAPISPQTLHFDTDRPYGMAVVSFRMPGYGSPDYAASQVLSDVLSSERGDLYGLVPEGRALSAGFSLNTFSESGMGFAAGMFPKGGDSDALLAEIRHVLENYLKKGFPQELVEAAKRKEVASAEFRKNSVSGLASSWSEALAVEGRQSPDDDIAAIRAVTVEDVNRVARQYLLFDHSITAILTPSVSGKPVASRGFGGKESFASKEVRAVKLPDWAKRDMKKLAVPESSVHPSDFRLANGIRLIVQPESVSDTVSVYGHIDNKPDLEEPQGKEGVAKVMGSLFSYGTEKQDRMVFQKALDDIAADESAGVDFSLQVLKEGFEKGVALLAENELHPAFPEAAFRIVKRQVAQSAAGELQSPGYQTGRALKMALFPESDPSLRETTPKSVSPLTLEDVKSYYKKVFRPDLTTLVVIGNVDPEKVKAEIEKCFGSWRAEGSRPETDLPEVPLSKPSAASVPDRSRIQDQVMLAETLGINRFSPDYYALELGNHVLGGAFYATRFYRDLREDSGLVYYVGSSFQVSKTRGIYMVSYAADPANVGKARAIVERDLKTMSEKPVSDKELRQAKVLLLRKMSLSESSIDNIASGLISRSVIGLPLDEPSRAARRYIGMTSKQVRDAYARWISVARLSQVTEGPAPH